MQHYIPFAATLAPASVDKDRPMVTKLFEHLFIAAATALVVLYGENQQQNVTEKEVERRLAEISDNVRELRRETAAPVIELRTKVEALEGRVTRVETVRGR